MPTLIEIDTGYRHPIADHAVIGRGATCEVRIDDPMVSASHAEILRAIDGSFQIRDLESRRGTYVGSRKVKEAPLRNGDELMIGPLRLRFEDEAAAGSLAGDHEELTRLRAIVTLGRAIGVEHDLGRLCDRVLETCFQLLDADRGAIVIYEPQSKAPFLTVTRLRAGGAPFAVSTSVLGQVMVTHEPYLRTEVDSDLVLKRSESLSAHGVRSVMAVPLRYETIETEWLGVILLDSQVVSRVFAPRDLELLQAIAGPAALGIKNAMLVRRLDTVVDDEWRRLDRVVRDLPIGVVVLDDKRTCTMVNHWLAKRPQLGDLRVGAVVDAIAGLPCDRMIGADFRTHAMSPEGDRMLSIVATTTGRETVVVIDDITEQRERQNREAHRDRVAMVGQLAGGVAHDFNNLLHVILTCADMLEEDLADRPESLEHANQIVHAATSAAELTRQLLTFSRRELVKPKVVDVPSVVTAMERLLLRALGSQIELSSTIGPRIPRILINGSQLEQILMNLVVNARDAMLGHGRIKLDVSGVDLDAATATQHGITAGRYVAIEVADTGFGIEPDVIDRVFEPYFTTKARGKGTGLGLATVHGIVQQAGGGIAVESIVGRGTTFRIYLPATEIAGDDPRPATAASTCTGTILLVDDDDHVRRVTERLLRNAGYDVLTADSSNAALEVSRGFARTIDLLLTDIVMPGASGRDLARELGYERPAMPVIFMSGYHQQTPIGNSQFIAKPFSRSELLDKLRDALADASAAKVA